MYRWGVPEQYVSDSGGTPEYERQERSYFKRGFVS